MREIRSQESGFRNQWIVVRRDAGHAKRDKGYGGRSVKRTAVLERPKGVMASTAFSDEKSPDAFTSRLLGILLSE